MALSDTITSMQGHLSEAYVTLENKGATIPEHKNLENLSNTIESIVSSGGAASSYGDVPYFDGGRYGAIAYVGANNEVAYYTAISSNDLVLDGDAYTDTAKVVKTLSDGYVIRRGHILGYSFGSQTYTSSVPQYFLAQCRNLVALYGLETRNWTTVNSYFLYTCSSFNQPLVLPNSLTSIGTYFMQNCFAFNQPLIIPNKVTTIGTYFLGGCSAFNQSLILPNTLTSINQYFLYGCQSFNQPLTIPDNVTSIGTNFLDSCFCFNQPITIPQKVTQLNTNFLLKCYSFNQPIVIPSGITTIPSSFLNDCTSFNQPLTIPETVTKLNTAFMYLSSSSKNPTDFIGPLYIESDATPPTDNNTLSTSSSSSLSYTRGITLAGPNAQAWKDALPDRAVSPFRKLILGSQLIYAIIVTVVGICLTNTQL